MVTSPSLFGLTLAVRKRPPSPDIDTPGSGISWFPSISRSKNSPMISRRRSTTTGLWHALTSTRKVNGVPVKLSVHSNVVPYNEQSALAPKNNYERNS